MTYTEYVSHFSLWALAKAPLLVGCDVTNMSDPILAIFTNPEVIAVNQDPLGVQGRRVRSNNKQQTTPPLTHSTPHTQVQRDNSTQTEVWASPLVDRSIAVILFNRSPATTSVTVQWQRIGLNIHKECTGMLLPFTLTLHPPPSL